MKANNKTREAWLTRLYLTAFPNVARYIARQGGTLEDAKDVFQDALIIYYEKAMAGNLQLTHTEQAYLLGIAKHLWYNMQQRLRKQMSNDVLNLTMIAQEETLQPSAKRLLRYLEAAGQKCMDILQAFYYDKQNMREIAERFGFSGERSATVQKHKCLEKVRNNVKEKALAYEDFCN